ncbi:MAG: S8/S53 family peptidase [Gammaproteobacteria bacterium]|nr:S8/S53 family peptidase [Gammaproteobacteria bacterium]
MRFFLPIKSWSGIVLLLLPISLAANAWQPQKLLEFTTASCLGWETSGRPAAGYGAEADSQTVIMFRGRQIGTRHRLTIDEKATVELDVLDRSGRPTRFVGSLFSGFGDPLLLMAVNSGCSLQVARRINYTEQGQAIDIDTLDDDLAPRGDPDLLNPPLQFSERDADKVLKHPGDTPPLRVAIVDSGVNYLLPEINRRLARDDDNRLVGFDFWEMDDLPFDAHPVDSGFFLQRHGTRTASILLREAPGIELVPYRYPRPDMSRMQALIEHADENQVGIVGMPLGSNRQEDWGAFERAARAHPHMLFIVSAGNDGRDIDERPVYPAAIGLDNMLVVTSADDFVRPAERTNWGRISVDYLVPAERIEATDYSGAATRVSGSSYAVARVTALAARIKMARRDRHATDIIAELRRRYGGQGVAALDWVSSGYIADPLAGAPVRFATLPNLEINFTQPVEAGFVLPLDLLVLDPSWTRATIEKTVQAAYDILRQCSIVAGDVSVRVFGGDDYLRDLSTGNARTLLEAANTAHATVVFARDTLMQAQFTGEAFGIGNTRMRPWLANSVWLMPDVDDPGIALAHELYHVIANNGAHVEGAANLMQGRTRPDSTALTPEQCHLARVNGLANQLLN